MAKDQQDELDSLPDDDEDAHDESAQDELRQPYLDTLDDSEEDEGDMFESSVDNEEYAELVMSPVVLYFLTDKCSTSKSMKGT